MGSHKSTLAHLLPDSHGSGHGSQTVKPSAYPTPGWPRLLKALGEQGRGWEGCEEHNLCQLRAPQNNECYLPVTRASITSLPALPTTMSNSQAGPFLVLRLVFLLVPCGLLARWELRHYFICREERKAPGMGPYSIPFQLRLVSL